MTRHYAEPKIIILLTRKIFLKGIQMHKFNRLIKNRKTKMFYFPGTSSHQLLHYLDVHLKNKSNDTVIIHTGINK